MTQHPRTKAGLTKATRRSGRPTQRDTLRKSETLIGVATDFFAEHGFSGTTIEAVAEAANMGKQAVYTRFTDKESLFQAVVQRLKEKPVFQELPTPDGHPLAEGLPRRIRAIFTDAARPGAMTVSKLAMREGHRFPDLVLLLVEGTLARYTRPLAAYIDTRKTAGEVREIDPFEAASLCIDLIFAEISRSVYMDAPLSPKKIEQSVARIAVLMLRGIAAGQGGR